MSSVWVVCEYLGLEAYLVQLAALLEALHAVLHQEQADAVGRRLGLTVRYRHHDDQVAHPPVGDEHLRGGKGGKSGVI